MWRVLSGLLILPIAASACEETTGSNPRPLDITLAVSPESARVWVDDTLELFAVRDGREADSLSLGLLSWTVSDTTVLRMVSMRDSSLTVVATGSGTATVTARAGTFSDRADIVVYREGDLLASYAFYDRNFINGVAVGEDGAVYLLRTDGLQLVSLDSALVLRWSRDVGSSWMNPAIGPVGRIHVTPFRATMTFTAAGSQLWLDSIVGNGETAPAIDGAGNVYVGGFRFVFDSTAGSSVREWRFVRFAPSGQATVLGTWDCTLKTPPVIVSDSVVIWADLCSTVVGMSLDGSVIWVDSLASKLRYFAPSVAGDGRTVYLPARSHVYAIDGLTGTVLHEWDHAYGLPLAPIVGSDGTIYIQTRRRLVALNPDFSIKWEADSMGGTYNNENAGGGPALAAGGVLYVACGLDLCAVNTADGSLRWRKSLPVAGMPGQIVIMPDSSILFATINQVAGAFGDSVYVLKLAGRFPLADAPWPVDGGDLRRTRGGTLWTGGRQ